MFIITCPHCHRDSYSADEVSFLPCPYCGVKHSGKYGIEKRSEERMVKEIPFRLTLHEHLYEASIRDLSDKGLGIHIFNDPSIEKGDILSISFGDHQFSAKVIWANKMPKKSTVGLQRVGSGLNI